VTPGGRVLLDDGVASVRCVAASSSLLMARVIPDIQLHPPASSCLCVLCGITAIRLSRLALQPFPFYHVMLSTTSCKGRQQGRNRISCQLIAYSCTYIYICTYLFAQVHSIFLRKRDRGNPQTEHFASQNTHTKHTCAPLKHRTHFFSRISSGHVGVQHPVCLATVSPDAGVYVV